MKRIGLILLLCCLFACNSSSFVYEEQESALDTIEMVVNHPPSKIVMYAENTELKAEALSQEEIAKVLDWFKEVEYFNQIAYDVNNGIELYFYDNSGNVVELEYKEEINPNWANHYIGIPGSNSKIWIKVSQPFREVLPDFIAVDEKSADFEQNEKFRFLEVVTQDVDSFRDLKNPEDLLVMLVDEMETQSFCSMSNLGKVQCDNEEIEIEDKVRFNEVKRYLVKDVQDRLDYLFVDAFQIKDLKSGLLGYRDGEVYYLDTASESILKISIDGYMVPYTHRYPARLIRQSGNSSIYEAVRVKVAPHEEYRDDYFLQGEIVSFDASRFNSDIIEEKLNELQHYEVTMEGNKIKSVKVLNAIGPFEAPISKDELMELYELDKASIKLYPDILLIGLYRDLSYYYHINENKGLLIIQSPHESHLFDRSTGENLSNLEVIERYLPDGIDAFIQQQVNLPVCSHTYEEQLGVRCVDYLDPFFDLDYGDVIAPTDFYIDEDGNLALDVRIKEDGGVVEVKSLKVN